MKPPKYELWCCHRPVILATWAAQESDSLQAAVPGCEKPRTRCATPQELDGGGDAGTHNASGCMPCKPQELKVPLFVRSNSGRSAASGVSGRRRRCGRIASRSTLYARGTELIVDIEQGISRNVNMTWSEGDGGLMKTGTTPDGNQYILQNPYRPLRCMLNVQDHRQPRWEVTFHFMPPRSVLRTTRYWVWASASHSGDFLPRTSGSSGQPLQRFVD